MDEKLKEIVINFTRKLGYYLWLLLLITGCKKPYNPPIIQTANTFLVVEGVINSGGDSTIIKLSHTVPITNKSTNLPVLYASVTVESSQGDVLKLKEAGSGKYVSPGLTIDKSKNYRLHIKTTDNKEYGSDFVPVQTTPPIDSVGFKITNEGLLIYANAHDPNNAVQYYRWDYDEEWEFHSAFISKYIINTHLSHGVLVSGIQDIAERDALNQVYFCYKGDVSTDIVLGSTASLQQAVIYQNPIVSILSSSEKVEAEYSILVRQYALTKEAYNFYTELRKNTEQLGSIFDALPSQPKGNVHCISNPTEPVTGFVCINNVHSRRIFIQRAQLPLSWVTQYPYACAAPILVSGFTAGAFLFTIPHANLLADTVGGLYAISYECSDCTIRGNRTPPAYWK